MKKFTILLSSVFCYGVMNAQTLLFDNGPLVNSPGAGAGGADVSNLHDGLTTYGAGHAVSTSFKVADDFTVPAAGWTIDSIIFFAYQTGSGNTSSITGVRLGVWDASPMIGANIIYGDTGVSAAGMATYWSGIYRTTDVALTDVARPIMRDNVPTPGLTLTAGTYFLSWQTDGSAAFTGPWAPPVTIAGVTTTGDALQYNPGTGTWDPLNDGGTLTPQGLPFEIYGHANTSGTLNDSCITSVDLTSSIGQPVGVVQTTGPYDNTNASTGSDDPATGFECFGEPDGTGTNPTLENTLWYSFVGDGGLYFIETGTCSGVTNYIDDGDTQIAIYDGTCGALNPLACNEDGPSATTTTYPAGLNFQTTAGTTYYMLIDGFNFNGALSTGEFCVHITQLASVACGAAGITVGTETQSTDTLCFNTILTVTVAGTVAPTVGAFSGLSWIISTADLAGTPDPLNDPSVVATYTIQNPAPDTSFRTYINNAAGILTPGSVYYWTPVVFGNATAVTTPPTFLSDLLLDITCTYTGTSMAVFVAAQGDPACTVGINENTTVNGNLGITNIYPVPVKDKVTFTLNTKERSMVSISLKDNLGKEVQSSQVNTVAGENIVTLDLSKQSAGVYFITASSDAGTVVSKFVKE